MNKLFAVVALATVIASPAFAQSFDPSVGSGNITQQQPSAQGAVGAYALHMQIGRQAAPQPGAPTAAEKNLFDRIGVE
jgi:hypothetical protein